MPSIFGFYLGLGSTGWRCEDRQKERGQWCSRVIMLFVLPVMLLESSCLYEGPCFGQSNCLSSATSLPSKCPLFLIPFHASVTGPTYCTQIVYTKLQPSEVLTITWGEVTNIAGGQHWENTNNSGFLVNDLWIQSSSAAQSAELLESVSFGRKEDVLFNLSHSSSYGFPFALWLASLLHFLQCFHACISR